MAIIILSQYLNSLLVLGYELHESICWSKWDDFHEVWLVSGSEGLTNNKWDKRIPPVSSLL